MSKSTLPITDGGDACRVIHVSKDETGTVAHAAEELSTWIQKISGAKLPIVGDIDLSHCVAIAPPSYKLHPRGNQADLHDQGFTLHADGDHLQIVGGSPVGTLYGTLSFLERHVGCRWLTSHASHVPKNPSVQVPEINETQIPAFEYREVFYRDAWEWRFAERNKINGQGVKGMDSRELHRGWGTWCHTFARHVPPEKYLAAHPDYFALVDGERVGDGQLCLTNPDVFRLVVDDLHWRMEKQPDALYWSVSQNDCFRNCQCERCSQIDRAEGSEMGSLLQFINRIAAEFPGKIISTLAYQYTRKPPKTIRPADNVHIMLCSIECNRSRPIESDPDSDSFRNDVEGWAAICDNLFVWDYVIQFANLVSPFPNLHVLKQNLQFFARNSVRGIFSQGNREHGGEMAELRAYLLAKLSWDLSYDVDRGIDEFLLGYYGAAAESIGEYIAKMHSALIDSGDQLKIFGGPEDGGNTYLTRARIKAYGDLFDAAEESVHGDPELLLRAQTARMPVQYAELVLGYADADRMRDLVKKFAKVARRTGLKKIEEWKVTVDDFLRKIESEKLG